MTFNTGIQPYFKITFLQTGRFQIMEEPRGAVLVTHYVYTDKKKSIFNRKLVWLWFNKMGGRSSCKAFGYGLDGPCSNPDGGFWDFSPVFRAQNAPGTQSVSCKISTRAFPGVNTVEPIPGSWEYSWVYQSTGNNMVGAHWKNGWGKNASYDICLKLRANGNIERRRALLWTVRTSTFSLRSHRDPIAFFTALPRVTDQKSTMKCYLILRKLHRTRKIFLKIILRPCKINQLM